MWQRFKSLVSYQKGPSDDIQRDSATSQETSNSTKRHKIESDIQRDTCMSQEARYNIDKCYALLTGADSATNGRTYLGFVRKDLERMERVLKELQFEVSNPCLDRDGVSRAFLFDDCICDKGNTRDLSQYSCSLFYFSGHGDKERVLLSNGDSATYAEIVQQFNASSTERPKIFIFDCCLADLEESREGCSELHLRDIPPHVLVVFGCMPDELAYGDKETGSFFTLKLDNKLRAFVEKLSFFNIIHQVTGASKDPKHVVNAFVISTFQKDLYFKGRLNQRRPLFHSKKDVMDHIETIGHGVKVLVCYSPDPRGCASDQHEGRSKRVKDTRMRIAHLALRLERHGFSVFTDLLKGGEDPDQLLKWYYNHIENDDFILVVHSQRLKELCQTERLDDNSDWQTKLVYNCCNNFYSYLSNNTDCRRFIPVVIDCMGHCSVPSLFQGKSLYDVTEEKEFNYDSDPSHCGFDALVCRMAGIDRAKIEHPPIRGPVQTITGEGTVYMDDPEPDITSYLTLKPGYRYVSPEQHSDTPKVPRLVQLTALPLPPEPSLHAPPPPQATPPHPLPPPPPPPSSQSAWVSAQASGGSDPLASLPCSPVNQTTFLWLCANIVQWKFVARFLGVSESDIAAIEAREPDDLRERCYQMLLLWNRRNPQGTYRDIGAAIAESSKNRHLLGGYVEEVQKLLSGHEHME
eukprot:Em0015g868a